MNQENKSEDKPIDEEEPKLQPENEILIGVDQKLADLMYRGWTMLADSCPLESCGCPLMKSLDGQKYCVQCEMWHFDKERKKQKFTELASWKGKQQIQVKPCEIGKIPKNMVNFAYTLKASVIQALQVKLVYLSSQLNGETDLGKTKELLECIQICMENIQATKQLNN